MPKRQLPLQLASASFLIGFVPYTSPVKTPPLPSFWAEWICLGLGLWLLLLLRAAPRAGVPVASTPGVRLVQVPAASALLLAVAALIALQVLVVPPRFIGGSLIAVAQLLFAAAICSSAARYAADRSEALVLRPWALGLITALALNGAAVVAERNGWKLNGLTWVAAETDGRAVGLMGQPNQLAVVAVLGWCAALYLWGHRQSRPMWLTACSVVAGAIAAASASRGGVVIAMAAGALFLIVGNRGATDSRAARRTLIVAAAAFAAGYLLWLWTGPTGGDSSATVMRSDTRGRVELIRDAWSLSAAHAWFGVGFGNFRSARWLELDDSMSEPNAEHAHNLVLQFGAEFGLLATSLLLAAVLWWITRVYRTWASKLVTPEMLFAGLVLVVIGGYSLTEYPLWFTYFLVPFALALGFVRAPVWTIRLVRVRPMPVAYGLTIAIGLAAWLATAWDYGRSEAVYNNALHSLERAPVKSTLIVVPVAEIRQIALITSFDTHSTRMLARTLLPNGMFMADKLAITERAMLAFVNWETVSRHIAFLCRDGRYDEARRIWARTERNAMLRSETFQAMQRMASTHAGLQRFVDEIGPYPSSVGPIPTP